MLARTFLVAAVALSLVAVPFATGAPAEAAASGLAGCDVDCGGEGDVRCAGLICDLVNVVCYVVTKAPCVR